jgi:general L-amino acid transport system permease protein
MKSQTMPQLDLDASMDLRDRIRQLQEDFFSTPGQSVLTVICVALIGLTLWKLLGWAFVGAVWKGDPDACRQATGACWAVIAARYRLILFGLYPYAEQWRSALACVAILVTVVFSCLPFFWSAVRLPLVWITGFATYYLLMRGGFLGLPLVLETDWGGLALTMFVFSLTVLIGMPLAIALLRRSTLPVIATVTGVFIDAVRSMPLLAILFAAAIILPFALPDILVGDKLYRVIAGSALFFSVYQAEIIRGGMQALPRGQQEASEALGLNYWQMVSRITLPQAFRYALPPTINQVVITFMETSLIVILGFFEVTASGNAAFSSGGWNDHYIEVYCFVALIYFTFTFSLSRYGAYLEKRLRRASR